MRHIGDGDWEITALHLIWQVKPQNANEGCSVNLPVVSGQAGMFTLNALEKKLDLPIFVSKCQRFLSYRRTHTAPVRYFMLRTAGALQDFMRKAHWWPLCRTYGLYEADFRRLDWRQFLCCRLLRLWTHSQSSRRCVTMPEHRIN